jgi:hypothetical protein
MKVRKLEQRDASGCRTKTGKFYGIFMDFAGRLRRLPLMADRKSSVELARTADQLNSLKAAGTSNVLPPEIARKVEDSIGENAIPTRRRKHAQQTTVVSGPANGRGADGATRSGRRVPPGINNQSWQGDC